MLVREIMTQRVHSVYTDTVVHEVAQLMSAHDVSGLPVLDRSEQLVGIVTELDLLVRNDRLEMPLFLQVFDAVIPLEMPGHLDHRLRHMLGTRAEDVMTRDVHTAAPDVGVEELVHLMVKKRVNPVPIVEAGRLVGIVSRSDIIRMMATDATKSARTPTET